MAKFCSKHFSDLEKYFLFPKCDPLLVDHLCDKNEMHKLAVGNDVPVPRTLLGSSELTVDQCLETIGLPAIVKSVDWVDVTHRPTTKTVIVRSPDELVSELGKNNNLCFSNVLVQEYIDVPGNEDWMFNGYFDDQCNCLISFTGRKIRQAPVYTGFSTLGECASNRTLRELSIKFLQQIGYKGIVDIDYTYDPRDGRYKILDVNPRVGASFRIFVGYHGIDVVRAMYLDITGQTVPDDIQVDGRKWIIEDADLRSTYQYFRKGEITIGNYLKSLRGVKEGAWFALDDPVPSFMRVISHINSKILRRSGD